MKSFQRLATGLILGTAMLCLAGPAHASPVCTIPTSVTLTVLPAGCGAVLTNGPITFTNVHATNGDSHNVEIDSLLLFGMDVENFSARLVIQGFDHDLTTGITTGFNVVDPSIDFETTNESIALPADGAPHTFQILHFIAPFPGGLFKLNFGEAGRPQQSNLDKVISIADASVPGFFTVSSFFDIYTELSLDGGFGGTWRVADNDFVGDANGPGSILQLQNVPEPASLVLLGTGIATLAGRRFRRR